MHNWGDLCVRVQYEYLPADHGPMFHQVVYHSRHFTGNRVHNVDTFPHPGHPQHGQEAGGQGEDGARGFHLGGAAYTGSHVQVLLLSFILIVLAYKWLLFRLLVSKIYHIHLLLRLLLNGSVWQSALLRKLFSFTWRIEFTRELSLKLFLDGKLFLPSSLLWNALIISTYSPIEFPWTVISYSTFCPHMQRDDLFSSKVLTFVVMLVEVFRITTSGTDTCTPISLVSILVFYFTVLFSMQECLPLK